MNLDELKVFVYGTLKPGECNYQRYCQGKVVDHKRAIAFGKLFHLHLRGYPAMTPGDSLIQGFLLTFNDPTILNILDQLEDYEPQRTLAENEYYRQKIPIYDLSNQPLGLAWVYLMNPHRVKELAGTPIPSGWWDSSLGSRQS